MRSVCVYVLPFDEPNACYEPFLFCLDFFRIFFAL